MYFIPVWRFPVAVMLWSCIIYVTMFIVHSIVVVVVTLLGHGKVI